MLKKLALPMMAIITFLVFINTTCRHTEIAVIEITKQPAKTVSVVAGEATTLTVTASVEKGMTLAYQWYSNTSNSTKGGTAIKGETKSSYTVPASLKAGTYYYFCQLTASDGTSMSSNVTAVTVANFVGINNIFGIPTTIYTGNCNLSENVTFSPVTASFQIITWSVVDAGTTGATISGNILNTKTAGKVKILATVKNGKGIGANYTQEFTITVNSFVPVTNISIMYNEIIIGSGGLFLYGMVEPYDATNKDVQWSIVNAGTTGATIDKSSSTPVLMATTVGTVTIRATIINGKTPTTNFTKDFTITVKSYEDGSQGYPYQVKNVSDLKKVGTETVGWTMSAHYIQIANIDLIAETWMPIGGGIPSPFSTEAPFTGSYNGNGYTISNLTGAVTGLFGKIGEGGVVKNVRLSNVSVNSTESLVGGISAMNDGTIEYCSVHIKSPSGITGGSTVGGVTGLNTKTIRNCFVTGGTVSAVRGSSPFSNEDAGGIVGQNGGVVENCYTSVNITGRDIGGVAGWNSNGGKLQYCYATGNITCPTSASATLVGGMVGRNQGSTVSNCVALSKSLVSDNYIGRIAVIYLSGTSTLNPNWARENMQVTNRNGTVTDVPNINGVWGANVSAVDYHGANSGTWWSNTAGFPATAWSFAANRLPHLKGFDGITQNPTVTP